MSRRRDSFIPRNGHATPPKRLHSGENENAVSFGPLPEHRPVEKMHIMSFLNSKGIHDINSVEIVGQYAFIVFDSRESADNAVKRCDESRFFSKTVKVRQIWSILGQNQSDSIRNDAINPIHPANLYDTCGLLPPMMGFNEQCNFPPAVPMLNQRPHLPGVPLHDAIPAQLPDQFIGGFRPLHKTDVTPKNEAQQHRFASRSSARPDEKRGMERMSGGGDRRSARKDEHRHGRSRSKSRSKRRRSRSRSRERRSSHTAASASKKPKIGTEFPRHERLLDRVQADKKVSEVKPPGENDASAAYGQLIAQRLRKMTEKQRAFAWMKIEEIMFSVEFGSADQVSSSAAPTNQMAADTTATTPTFSRASVQPPHAHMPQQQQMSYRQQPAAVQSVNQQHSRPKWPPMQTQQSTYDAVPMMNTAPRMRRPY